MTKIIVCSDSHGKKDRINRLAKEYDYNYFFFLGDGMSDIGDWDLLDNVECVRGNCDYFSTEQYDRILEIEDKRVLLTHGNNYGVKGGIGALAKYAKANKIDIALFGHTHRFTKEEVDGVMLFNPGSVKNGSAAILTIDKSGVNFEQIVAD